MIKTDALALAGMTQYLEHQPVHWRVSGSIPSQEHVPGLHPQSAHMQEAIN